MKKVLQKKNYNLYNSTNVGSVYQFYDRIITVIFNRKCTRTRFRFKINQQINKT